MWLLDANMDVHLVRVLNDYGISSDTAGNRGWKALSNGELVAAAVAAGFVCLLTRDQLFGESASRALKSFPEFAVVVVDVPQQPWMQYRVRFVAQWAKRPIVPVAGQLTHWP
jgi:predicted nuclease of predicted toxin-antitoxin system